MEKDALSFENLHEEERVFLNVHTAKEELEEKPVQ